MFSVFTVFLLRLYFLDYSACTAVIKHTNEMHMDKSLCLKQI